MAWRSGAPCAAAIHGQREQRAARPPCAPALCPSCANSLALGRARVALAEGGASALRAQLEALGLGLEGAEEELDLDRVIDSGCLRRDLRLVLELEGDSHRYQAAPLREVVMPQEV